MSPMRRRAIRPGIVIDIVPLVPIAATKSAFFSYLPKEPEQSIPRGSVVSIPFGPRQVHGIVWGERRLSEHTRTGFRYKALERVLASAFLPEASLQLAEFLAEASRIGLGSALSRFVPTQFFPLEQPTVIRQRAPSSKRRKSVAAHNRCVSLLLSLPVSEGLFFAQGKDLWPIFRTLIRKSIAKKRQTIILFPDDISSLTDIERSIEDFGAQSVAVFSGRMTQKAKATEQERVRKGAARIIIGTASVLFMPYHRLGLILERGADAPSFESVGPPFSIPAHAVARKMAEIAGARYLRVSSSPSFESFFHAQENNALKMLPSPARTTRHEIINLRLEHWKKKSNPVSEPLIEALKSSLVRKEQAIVVVHRSRMSAFSVCCECARVLRCPSCARALSYRSRGDYRCEECRVEAGSTPSCPSCGSLAFKQIGMGTERVERDLSRRFPSAKITRIDTRTHSRSLTLREVDAFRHKKRDILVVTDRVLFGEGLPPVPLVGMIDPDTLFGLPRFDGDEYAVRTIFRASELVEEPNGTLYIQTFHPENPLFEFPRSQSLPEFFLTLQEERRRFLYPPFGRVTRLSCRLASESALHREVSRVTSLLEDYQATLPVETRLSVSDHTKKFRGQWFEKSLSLREPYPRHPSDPSPFDSILKNLPHSWIIENTFF